MLQGRRTSQGSRGLSPGTFWNLLNGSFSLIAEKGNKNSLQKKVTPLSPGTFYLAASPLQCCTYVQCSYTQLSMSVVVKTSTFCYCSFLMLDCCLFYFIRTHQWPSAFWLIFRKVERIPEHTYHFDSIKFGLLRWLRKEKTSSFIGLPKKTSSRLNIFRGSDHLNMFLFGIIITILDV